MKKNITVLPGDGIGPEVVNQAIKVVKSINHIYNHEFNLNYDLIGAAAINKHGEPLSIETINACKQSDAVLVGAIGEPKYDNNPCAKVRPEQGLLKLRKELKLYANIRPINNYKMLEDASPLKNHKLEGVDILIYRELTSGIYFGEKTLSADGKTASDNCSYTVEEIERISKLAFESARNRNKKLTLVDKANVLETSRLWRKVVQKMALDFTDVEVECMYVDNAAMQLVLNPKLFDVILTENMFGDILSDLASVLTGSLGLLPSSSIGMSNGLFEPCHGSYPQAAGRDIANPIATILSVAMMYDYFDLKQEAQTIRSAVNWSLHEGLSTKDITEDYLNCSCVGDLICYYIEEKGEVALNKKYILEAKNCII